MLSAARATDPEIVTAVDSHSGAATSVSAGTNEVGVRAELECSKLI